MPADDACLCWSVEPRRRQKTAVKHTPARTRSCSSSCSSSCLSSWRSWLRQELAVVQYTWYQVRLGPASRTWLMVYICVQTLVIRLYCDKFRIISQTFRVRGFRVRCSALKSYFSLLVEAGPNRKTRLRWSCAFVADHALPALHCETHRQPSAPAFRNRFRTPTPDFGRQTT